MSFEGSDYYYYHITHELLQYNEHIRHFTFLPYPPQGN